VARAVVEAATAADPQLRYLPDSYARLLHFLREALPAHWLHSALRWYFRLN
jgi:hypothetical protein